MAGLSQRIGLVRIPGPVFAPIGIGVIVLHLLTLPTQGQCLPEQFAVLTAMDGAPEDEFGYSVAMTEDTIVVGAVRDDDAGLSSGSAIVYRENGGAWQQVAKLTPSDGAPASLFGFSVAINENTIVVGAPQDNSAGKDSGSAYVFREFGGAWQQIAKLTGNDTETEDLFGICVAIGGESIAIGAMGEDEGGIDSGSAYVFREVGGIWQQIAKLRAIDAAPNELFGCSISVSPTISGDTVLVGAMWDNGGGTRRGAAYLFRQIISGWQQVAKLTASDGATDDLFGSSVGIVGETLVVGARGDDEFGNVDAGAAYVFHREFGTWQEIAKLRALDAAEGDSFGISVSLSIEETIVVGALKHTELGATTGAVYVYGETDSSWDLKAIAESPEITVSDHFGWSVAVGGDLAAVGAKWADDAGTRSGSVHLYIVGYGSNDCNGNGVPDECDIANCSPEDRTCADCNGNGVPDVCDLGIGFPVENSKLLASDGAAQDNFGSSVSISGLTTIIGSPDDGSGVGSAYVFQGGGIAWHQTAKLTAIDSGGADRFGTSVSLCNDTAVIGAHRDSDAGLDSGAAYVFRNVDGIWEQIADLTAPDAASSDFFGLSVSISEETIVVGAPQDDNPISNAGSAYVFKEVAGTWQQVAKLTALDGATNDRFGSSVCVDGNAVVIGAIGDDDGGTDSGSAYIFREIEGDWQQIAKLIASDATSFDRFGISVALSGGTALIGAPSGNQFVVGAGSAYIFRDFGTTWHQVALLTASDASANDNFGHSVSLRYGNAVIGAYLDDEGASDTGSAYLIRESGGGWHQIAKLTAGDLGAGDSFGESVSVSNGWAVVGADRDDDLGTDGGSAYVFELPDLLLAGDLDGDWDVDLEDRAILVDVLIGEDNAADHVFRADVDCSGTVDGRDIQAFVAEFILRPE